MEEVGKLAKKTGNLHCLVLEQMDIAPQGKRKGPEEAREGRNEPGHCRVWLYGVWRTGPAAVMTTIHKPSPYTQAQDSIFFFKLIFFFKAKPNLIKCSSNPLSSKFTQFVVWTSFLCIFSYEVRACSLPNIFSSFGSAFRRHVLKAWASGLLSHHDVDTEVLLLESGGERGWGLTAGGRETATLRCRGQEACSLPSIICFCDLDPEASFEPQRRLSGRALSFITVSHIR